MTALTWTNWVGNQSFSPAAVIVARSEDEVREQVTKAAADGYGISSVGAGHSFTPIVETDGVLLDLGDLSGITGIDTNRLLVTAGPATTIAAFGQPLWDEGLSLSNQGDIDAQTIAGAIATATHGSGRRLPNFSAVLEGARLVDGTGEVVEVSGDTNADLLPALQTSIGVLGIITQVTIKVAPAYQLHARTDVMTMGELMERWDSDLEEYRHFGVFWMPTDESARLYNLEGARADDCVVKRYRAFDAEAASPALDPHERFGPAFEIYPMVYDPNFHEVEYFLPLEEAHEIIAEMRHLMLRWLPWSVYPLEIRVVAKDQAWMSPNYQRDNLVVSISGEPGKDYWPYLRACDGLFSGFQGRPHWGKLHFMTADRVERLFPRYPEFVDLRRRLDPMGIFLNAHTRALFE